MIQHKGMIIIVSMTILVGCSGRLEYQEPNLGKYETAIIVNASKDRVWNYAVTRLTNQFIEISSLDKNSGLMNINYIGHPENYVDCGRIISEVRGVRGSRIYDFPAAQSDQKFEVMQHGYPFSVRWKMQLEAHSHLFFEEVAQNKTRIVAKTNYLLTRMLNVQGFWGSPLTEIDTLVFHGNERSSFPQAADGRATVCSATGKLDAEILQNLR